MAFNCRTGWQRDLAGLRLASAWPGTQIAEEQRKREEAEQRAAGKITIRGFEDSIARAVEKGLPGRIRLRSESRGRAARGG